MVQPRNRPSWRRRRFARTTTTYQERALQALGDPSRRQIFERLTQSPLPVGQLAREFPISRPAVSQHLKVPKQAGLVFDRQEGTCRFATAAST
jgi:predicted transcriptional regulator